MPNGASPLFIRTTGKIKEEEFFDMKQSWMIDPSKCSGCKTCEVICSLYHHSEVNLNRSRIKIVKWEEKGLDIPVVCQHCEVPVCMENCPTGALFQNDEGGFVAYRKELCIGCKLCLLVCPSGGISLDGEGSILKCDLCGGDPQCVKFCASKVIEYLPNIQVGEKYKRKVAKALIQSLDGGQR